MDFENTWTLLHILWIVPLFGLLVYYSSVKRKKILAKIFGDNAMKPQYSTLSRGRRYLRTWLLFGAILLVVVALARPRWGWRILPYSGRGRDLMIVLDVSKSMNSEDVKPSRLKHAKLFLRDLIKACPGDRFGLVAFAGTAFLDCPLTVDKTSLFQTLDETHTDSIPIGGTNVENALKTASTAFQAAEGGYRAIILVTDGDELSGDSAKAIAELKAKKIPLFVVGIGDPTGDGLIKITGTDGKTTLMRDSKGDLIKSRLNEPQLKKLAQSTNGIYIRSTETNPEMKPLLKRIRGLVPKEYEKGNNKRPIERFHYPLFAAVLLLLIRLGIGERRKTNGNGKKEILTALIALCFLIGGMPLQAQQTTDKPMPLKPLTLGEKIPEIKNNKDNKADEITAVDQYNRALQLQHKKQIEEAAKRYRKAINMSSSTPEVRGKSFQNMGVISHNQGRAVMGKDPDKALKIFDKTEEMYREAMRSDTHLKKVILNQQKLIDDRVLAKQIKKRKEELKKKQQEAKKKTQEALKQQQKENQQKNKKDQKKDKKDQKKKEQQQQQQKDQQQQDKKQSQQQKQKQQNKQQQNQKQKQEQQQQNQQQKKEQQQKETERKISEAQKAVDDLKKEAQKRNKSKVKESADQAQKELKKAQQEHNQGNGKKSEEHIKKALKKLGMSDSSKKNEGKQDQKGQEQKKDGEEKKNKGKEQKQQPKDGKLQKQKPQEKQGKGQKKPDEKEIDPRQAAALLELMANKEKDLREYLKEQQKKNSRNRKVLKDW